MRTLGLALAVSLMAAGAAFAQGPAQQLQAAPGVPLPLTVETILGDDCSVGPAPETRIVVHPVHGELALREGQLTRSGGACPPAPGYVVVYLADEDFNGDDRVTLEVTAAGRTTTLAFEILVKGQTAKPADVT